MSRSLSWIEETSLDRLSRLTRRPGRDTAVNPSENRPEAEAPSPAASPAHNGPTATKNASGANNDPSANDSRPKVKRSPPPDRSASTSRRPAATVRSATPMPVAANQDPWTLTPAQPWAAVMNPAGEGFKTTVPDLVYPPYMAIAARLELFRDWLRHYCPDGPFFVSDADGLPLLLERLRTSQAVTAVALERALHPLRGLLGSHRANAICIEIEDGRLIQAVWANTPLGRVAVGMAPPRPLEPAATAQVRDALIGLFGDEGLT